MEFFYVRFYLEILNSFCTYALNSTNVLTLYCICICVTNFVYLLLKKFAVLKDEFVFNCLEKTEWHYFLLVANKIS